MALTRRQFQVWQFLDSFIAENGFSPSFAEIGSSLNLTSLATVHKHIHTLEKKGFLRLGQNQSRSIELLELRPNLRKRGGASLEGSTPAAEPEVRYPEIPLMGLIAAGKPLEAIQTSESLSLKDFVGKPDVFLLKVTGDSMIEDHICDGDYVLVEKSANAENGDTVVALLHNEDATLKRYYREKDRKIRLQPANSAMAPIFIDENELVIQGRVIAVLRKY
jgi:repressor LexA